MALIHKEMTIDEIIAYCQEHNEVEWLKKVCAEKTARKVYPRITIRTPEGNIKKVVDKTKEPTIKYQPISFVEVKSRFMDKFAPNERKGKETKTTFHDKIKNL